MADNLIQMQHSTKGPASFSHEGKSFDSDEDGIIALPSPLVGHARSHGFSTDIPEKKPMKTLAKSAKGGAEDGEGSGKPSDVDEVKKSEKGAKSAKGGAE